MRRSVKIGLALAVAAGVGLGFSWDKIQNIRALMAYSSIFEADSIDENFRSLYKIYPSISIPAEGPVAEFDIETVQDVFPATYTYEGEELPLAPLLDDFHWTGMIILKDGQMIHEAYARDNSADLHHIEMSVSKSITSIIFGVAVDNGDIPNLNAMVTEYIPELVGTGYENVTIQQVLDMTSGIRYVEDYDDLNSDIVQTVVAMLRGSLDEFSTTIVSQREQGSFNQYASIETHILAWILRRATGKTYAEYFEENLWSKIGAQADARMLVDAVEEPVAFGGLNLVLRDLARIGQMVLNGGVSMTGEQVVSAEWLVQSTTPDTPQSKPGPNDLSDYPLGYKNQWWLPYPRDGSDFSAIGIYGQFLYVNPGRNVVIAMNSAYPEYNETDYELRMVSALQAIAKHVSP